MLNRVCCRGSTLVCLNQSNFHVISDVNTRNGNVYYYAIKVRLLGCTVGCANDIGRLKKNPNKANTESGILPQLTINKHNWFNSVEDIMMDNLFAYLTIWIKTEMCI